MKIAIYGRPVSSGFDSTISKLFKVLEDHGIEIYVYRPFHDFLSDERKLELKVNGIFNTHDEIIGNAEIMFSLGGDGTFLEAVSIVQVTALPFCRR